LISLIFIVTLKRAQRRSRVFGYILRQAKFVKAGMKSKSGTDGSQ